MGPRPPTVPTSHRPPAPTAGERCSCTTAITDLLEKNFDLGCPDQIIINREKVERGKAKPVYMRKCVIGGLPWKHGALPAVPSDPRPSVTVA